jgi:transcriptional regulator with XRE-family HTH domain
MDRVHALNLAMIRKAAELTQEELAERLGARQGDISRIENRSDLLLTEPTPPNT